MENKKAFNEITVEVDTTLEDLLNILQQNNFDKVYEYDMHDIYMIERNEDLSQKPLDILSDTLMLRSVIEKDKTTNLMLYKWKQYNDKEEILKQAEVRCGVDNIDNAEHILNIINWIRIFEIKDHIMVYANEKTELAVQLVNNNRIYIELEDYSKRLNKKYESVEELKEEFLSYNIPIKNNNFFAKKAVDELLNYLEQRK